MRIRTIKPEFFEDEKLAALPPHDRLMFIGLWMLADRNGVLEHRPAWIQAKVFPYEHGEAVDASQVLPRLILGKFVRSYSVDGKDYLWLPGFAKHQRVSGKEAQSEGRHPLPPKALGRNDGDSMAQGSNGEATVKHGNGPIPGNREQGKEWQGKDYASVPAHAKTAAAASEITIDQAMAQVEERDEVKIEPPPTPLRADEPGGQITWHSWRAVHGRVHVADRDEGAGWQALFNEYGPELMTEAYKRMVKRLEHGKRLYLSAMSAFMAENIIDDDQGAA